MQRYGGAWSGEVATGWAGLRAALSMVLGLGLCGVPYTGADLAGSDRHASLELQVRRLQLAAHLPLLRTRDRERPGRVDEHGGELVGYARAVLAKRRRLGPYFVTLAHLARRTGAPGVRPVWWANPGDRALRDCEDAFLLGDALLVAPVVESGADQRVVRLPPGRWYDTLTEESYEGPARVVLAAGLSSVPVLARGGSVVPVRGTGGGLELEVWAPAQGRRGRGVVVADIEDEGSVPQFERYVTRWDRGRVVVERDTAEGPRPADVPVRIRGL
jgi:alpha-glucosidase